MFYGVFFFGFCNVFFLFIYMVISLIDFSVRVDVKEVEKYKVFTPKQEFDQLATDNPVLKDFEQRFGLDFDV